MKTLTGSTAAKTAAFIIMLLSLMLMGLSAVGVYILADQDAYFDDGRSMKNDIIDSAASYYEGHLYNYADALMFEDYDFDNRAFEDMFGEENCNYFFTLYNESGEVVLTNYTATDTLRTYDAREFYNSHYYETYDEYSATYTPVEEEYHLILQSGVRGDLTAKDRLYYYVTYTDLLISNRYVLIVAAPLLLILSIVMLVFLLCAAGHHHGEQEVRLNAIDRIPFDLYIALLAAAVVAVMLMLANMFYEDVAFVFLVIAAVPLGLSVLMTVTTRIKTRTLFTNSVVYRLLHLLVKGGKLVGKVALKVPLYWKTALIWISLSMVELIVLLATDNSGYFPLYLLEKLILTPLIIWIVLNLQALRKAGKELANGNIEYTVQTHGMLPSFKEHGEHLNGIGEGLKIAVEKSTRSERMRAELITNVSHDIKTPLTSIINYVGLLKKDGLTSEHADEYVSVLDRQSARLKKLTEDLIEASKASTGNIKVNIVPLDANILLQQATAEYEDRLAKRSLQLMTRFKTDPAYIHADGQLLWRVFDNLLSNIVKYAKSDTRVYLSTEYMNDRIVIVFKNISKEPLDISGDELTERFVRGDSSRHTEGSGLGLSIAKSLTQLQNGTFDIQIDGDLFKTVITFTRSV